MVRIKKKGVSFRKNSDNRDRIKRLVRTNKDLEVAFRFLAQNRNNFRLLLAKLFRIEDVSSRKQIKLQDLIERLLSERLPCPLDGCSRPYFHPVKRIEEAIEKPDFFTNPMPLLAVLNDELRVLELEMELLFDKKIRRFFDAKILAIEEEGELTSKAAEALLLNQSLTPLSEAKAESFDPKMYLNLREYLYRQTPWGLKENLRSLRAGRFTALKTGEFDVLAYKRDWDRVLESISLLKRWPEEHNDIKPLSYEELLDRSGGSLSSRDIEEWEFDNLNKHRQLARRLNMAPKLDLTCSKLPPEEHRCWWKGQEDGGPSGLFPPLSKSFWFVYNYLTSRAYPPLKLESAISPSQFRVCEPDPELVKLQLEEARDLIPDHLITEQVRQEWESEFKEAMSLFEDKKISARTKLPGREELIRIDNRLLASFKRFKERDPKNKAFSDAPFVLGRDSESFSGENASYFRKKEEVELAVRIQEEASPDEVSIRGNLGRFQQAILRDELVREEDLIKTIAEERIKRLFEEVNLRRKAGEESLNGLPVRRFIFPGLEETVEGIDDKDLRKRRERYKKIKDRAERARKFVKKSLGSVSSLPKEESDFEDDD